MRWERGKQGGYDLNAYAATGTHTFVQGGDPPSLPLSLAPSLPLSTNPQRTLPVYSESFITLVICSPPRLATRVLGRAQRLKCAHRASRRRSAKADGLGNFVGLFLAHQLRHHPQAKVHGRAGSLWPARVSVFPCASVCSSVTLPHELPLRGGTRTALGTRFHGQLQL